MDVIAKPTDEGNLALAPTQLRRSAVTTVVPLRAIPSDFTPETERFLLSLDVLGLLAALVASWAVAAFLDPQLATDLIKTPVSFVQVACLLPMLALNALAGIYAGFGLCSAQKLRVHAVIGTVCFTGAVLAASVLDLAPQVLAATGLLYLVGAPLLRLMGRAYLHSQNRWGKPALVVGPDKQAELMRETLLQNWHLGLMPVTQKEAELQPTQAALIDTIVLAPGAIVSPSFGNGRTLYVMKDVGMLTRLSPPLANAWESFIFRDRFHSPRAFVWRTVKRCIDLAIGGLAFLLALPIMAVVAAIIYAIDPGPVFFAQKRFGLHGKPIQVLKLRSMYQDSAARLQHLLETDEKAAAEWAARYKLTNDPRVLPKIGAFIRRYSIDELPQLWGVITGELSLVGPRVFVDYDLAIYSEDALKTRQSVVPGLTGFWQVSVRSDGSNEDKVRYDMAYVRHWSIWMDLDILYRTFGVVLTGRGAV